MSIIDTEAAIRLGAIAAGPMLAVVGCFFAVSVTASPYHNIAAKAVGWAFAPTIGLLVGAQMTRELLPGWGNWGVAMLFGHGFFYTWAAAAALFHDDAFENYRRFAGWAGPACKKAWRTLRRGKPRPRVRLDDSFPEGGV